MAASWNIPHLFRNLGRNFPLRRIFETSELSRKILLIDLKKTLCTLFLAIAVLKPELRFFPVGALSHVPVSYRVDRYSSRRLIQYDMIQMQE